jgi:hypothetical protein
VSVEKVEIVFDEGVGFGPIPEGMVDLCEALLGGLAPLAAAEPGEASEVDPINEGSLERVFMVRAPEGLHVVDHFVVNHVTAVIHGFVLLDRVQHHRDIILICCVRGWEFAILVEITNGLNIPTNSSMFDSMLLDGVTTH